MPSILQGESILEQIKRQKARASIAASNGELAGRRLLVVLPRSLRAARRALMALSSLWRLGCILDVVAPSALSSSRWTARKTLRFHDLESDLPDGLLDAVDAVLTVLDRRTLARVCLGLDEDSGTQAVIEALWRGMAVLADVSGVFSSPSQSAELADVYSAYRERLESFGAHFVASEDCVPFLREKLGGRAISHSLKAAEKMPELVLCRGDGRPVMTSQDVRRLPSGTTFALPGNTIVTDEAKSVAASKGVNFCASKENDRRTS